MKKIFLSFVFIAGLLTLSTHTFPQLIITAQSDGAALAQKLVGEGISISNVILIADKRSTGFFNNLSGTKIGLDSGIVLTNGAAKSAMGIIGVDGDGVTPAYLTNSGTGAFASLDLGTPGDADLNFATGTITQDATILEFDFVPLGDSIKFRYVFSSEEYPTYPCMGVNDAFAFFIQGPGFATKTNIALVPGTTDPVTINNINDVHDCGLYPQYYLSNQPNVNFTHNGHTTIFIASAKVQPCATYHLKLVIADVGDGIYDSGVFLEAKSLSSNSYSIQNITPVDADGNSYLAEGCVPGKIRISRANATNFPETIQLAYSGTATNGVDVQLLPSSVTIPANETFIELDVIPLVDNIAEGIEELTISTLAPCLNGVATSTTSLQIRDYDILQLSPGAAPDTFYICRQSSQIITATTGYTIYQWDNNITLSDINSRTPIATPSGSLSKYICTATLGSCQAKDSITLKWKDISLLSKIDINCAGANTGQIKIEAGTDKEWIHPIEFSINNLPYQSDSSFYNLTQGIYTIKIKEVSSTCIDSITVPIIQLYPDLVAQLNLTTPTCLNGNDGKIETIAAGGKPTYNYAFDGGAYQPVNIFITQAGTHNIMVKDENGCTTSQQAILTLLNTVALNIPTNNYTICEGDNILLKIQSNAANFNWTPATSLNNNALMQPTANPATTTKYYVTAITGICNRIDSIIVNVNAAPLSNAGADINLCFGGSAQLSGSGGTTYLWKPSTFLSNAKINNPIIQHATASVQYLLQVIDANGCSSLKKDTVNLIVTNAVKIFAGNDTIVAINQPLQLNVVELSNAGVVQYNWTNPYHLSADNIANPIAILDKDFTYFVIGKTINNCEATDTIKIKVYKGPEIYVPTGFTPNNDDKNDKLKPTYVGIKELLYFRVFNRYGQIVFQTKDVSLGWDAIFNGKAQETGNFVWMAAAIDYLGNTIYRKGSTILLR